MAKITRRTKPSDKPVLGIDHNLLVSEVEKFAAEFNQTVESLSSMEFDDTVKTGTPDNTTTPSAYLKIKVGKQTFFLPVYK